MVRLARPVCLHLPEAPEQLLPAERRAAEHDRLPEGVVGMLHGFDGKDTTAVRCVAVRPLQASAQVLDLDGGVEDATGAETRLCDRIEPTYRVGQPRPSTQLIHVEQHSLS